jgi:hypothetical protein
VRYEKAVLGCVAGFCLFACSFFPLLTFLFNSSAGVAFSLEQLHIYVKHGDDKRGELGPKYIASTRFD